VPTTANRFPFICIKVPWLALKRSRLPEANLLAQFPVICNKFQRERGKSELRAIINTRQTLGGGGEIISACKKEARAKLSWLESGSINDDDDGNFCFLRCAPKAPTIINQKL
jgi:hypothetical protein